MNQILQNARTGALELAEVPAPAVGPGLVLVRNVYSVMSPGTEKMAMDFARKSMLGKARSRPDLVKQVVRKLRQEGPLPTYRTVINRLDAPQPLGYASAGIVEEVGPGVSFFAVGDRVACAGAGYANHAELVVVPENLTAHVPEGLPLEKAAFATLGAIAMQGLRVGEPTLGEVVAVVGLGLIGQLTVQLLLANGCRVYGVDLDPKRIEQARSQGMDFGAPPGDDHAPFLSHATGGHGVDLVIVTAASDSSAPIQLAAELCRHKGRVVAVGATAMDLDRRSFYEKELELRMSMSYGPGRYDRRYEEVGLDYPIAYVRWTEQRNLQAFVDDSVALVFITTGHDSHAALAEAALRGGKAVWLEKPIGLNEAEVARVVRAASESAGLLIVGHNRRFYYHAVEIRKAFADRKGHMALQYAVAAGPTPGGTWLTAHAVGGGRIVGEASHLVDLCNFMVGGLAATSEIRPLGTDPGSDDSTLLILSYPDGSQATIAYLANTGPDLPKEHWEAHADGKSAFCENYRTSIMPGAAERCAGSIGTRGRLPPSRSPSPRFPAAVSRPCGSRRSRAWRWQCCRARVAGRPAMREKPDWPGAGAPRDRGLRVGNRLGPLTSIPFSFFSHGRGLDATALPGILRTFRNPAAPTDVPPASRAFVGNGPCRGRGKPLNGTTAAFDERKSG